MNKNLLYGAIIITLLVVVIIVFLARIPELEHPQIKSSDWDQQDIDRVLSDCEMMFTQFQDMSQEERQDLKDEGYTASQIDKLVDMYDVTETQSKLFCECLLAQVIQYYPDQPPDYFEARLLKGSGYMRRYASVCEYHFY